MPTGWLENHFHIIQTPNTLENRYIIPYNLKVFPDKNVSAEFRQKNKHIQPRPEKKCSYKKESVLRISEVTY